MGQLSLEIVDFRLLGVDHAYVVGRFHLHRDAAHGGDASGPTTLVFRRTPAGWRVATIGIPMGSAPLWTIPIPLSAALIRA